MQSTRCSTLSTLVGEADEIECTNEREWNDVRGDSFVGAKLACGASAANDWWKIRGVVSCVGACGSDHGASVCCGQHFG